MHLLSWFQAIQIIKHRRGSIKQVWPFIKQYISGKVHFLCHFTCPKKKNSCVCNSNFSYLSKLAKYFLCAGKTVAFIFTVSQHYMVMPSQKSGHVVIMWPCVIPLSNKEVNQLMLVSNEHCEKKKSFISVHLHQITDLIKDKIVAEQLIQSCNHRLVIPTLYFV